MNTHVCVCHEHMCVCVMNQETPSSHSDQSFFEFHSIGMIDWITGNRLRLQDTSPPGRLGSQTGVRAESHEFSLSIIASPHPEMT